MNKKKLARKLSLTKETVRRLADGEMRRAAGAAKLNPLTLGPFCFTHDCTLTFGTGCNTANCMTLGTFCPTHDCTLTFTGC